MVLHRAPGPPCNTPKRFDCCWWRQQSHAATKLHRELHESQFRDEGTMLRYNPSLGRAGINQSPFCPAEILIEQAKPTQPVGSGFIMNKKLKVCQHTMDYSLWASVA